MPRPGEFIPNREELAWAAGFYDGEGCTYLHRKKGRTAFSARLDLSQTSPEPLERFQKAVGGLGQIRGPIPSTRGHQDHWKWTCQKGEHSQAVVAMLWGFLSGPKRDQAATALGPVGRQPKKGYACRHGHELTPQNTYITPRGSKNCRTCRRAASRASYRRSRLATTG